MTALLYRWIYRLHNDLRGQDLVEYALITGLVAVAGGAIFPTSLLPAVSTIFSRVNYIAQQASNQGS